MTKIRIPIHKHYLIIDSPVGFHLIANNDMDDVYRPSGAWQLDMWSLLTKEYFKQYPVFTLDLEYDETRLEEGEEVVYRESDINLGTGLSGVNGQGVQILGDSSGLAKEETLKDIKDILVNLDLKKKYKTFLGDEILNYLKQIDVYNEEEIYSKCFEFVQIFLGVILYKTYTVYKNKLFVIYNGTTTVYDIYGVKIKNDTANNKILLCVYYVNENNVSTMFSQELVNTVQVTICDYF